MGSKARTWVALTVVGALAMAAAGWFLLVGPKLGATADTRASIEDAQARTAVLNAQLASLSKQYAELDTYKKDLADLQVQVPDAADLAAYRRTIADAAKAAGVTIVSVGAGIPSLVAAPPPAAPTDAATAAASSDVTADPAAAGDAQAAAAAAATAAANSATGRLVGIPLSIEVVGGYANAMTFLATLQTGEQRLFLVGGLNATSQSDTPASGGRPALSAGDLQLAIDGYLMVLPPSQSLAAATGQAAAPATGDPVEPPVLPSSKRNPFAPIG